MREGGQFFYRSWGFDGSLLKAVYASIPFYTKNYEPYIIIKSLNPNQFYDIYISEEDKDTRMGWNKITTGVVLHGAITIRPGFEPRRRADRNKRDFLAKGVPLVGENKLIFKRWEI